jgi:hypothetical protein
LVPAHKHTTAADPATMDVDGTITAHPPIHRDVRFPDLRIEEELLPDRHAEEEHQDPKAPPDDLQRLSHRTGLDTFAHD